MPANLTRATDDGRPAMRITAANLPMLRVIRKIPTSFYSTEHRHVRSNDAGRPGQAFEARREATIPEHLDHPQTQKRSHRRRSKGASSPSKAAKPGADV